MTDHPQPPSTVRLFVALAPPDDAKDELAEALRPAYEKYPHLRWNRIEDWHVTLAFLGEYPATAVPLLMPALAHLAADHPSLALALTGGGHFDERLLWSGIKGELDGASTASPTRSRSPCGPAASPSRNGRFAPT